MEENYVESSSHSKQKFYFTIPDSVYASSKNKLLKNPH